MPEESVVVVDNAPYDCVRVENRHSKCKVKAETVSSLWDGKFSLTPLQAELRVPREKTYRTDHMLNAFDRVALETSPCELRSQPN
jgi:hypothetical protein